MKRLALLLIVLMAFAATAWADTSGQVVGSGGRSPAPSGQILGSGT